MATIKDIINVHLKYHCNQHRIAKVGLSVDLINISPEEVLQLVYTNRDLVFSVKTYRADDSNNIHICTIDLNVLDTTDCILTFKSDKLVSIQIGNIVIKLFHN